MEYLKSLWTVHPKRMKYSEVHIKDKLFKSIKWTNPSVTDGTPEILMDGSS